MNFKVGEKVVCIKTPWALPGYEVPIAGNTYTVMSLCCCPFCGNPQIRLYELQEVTDQGCFKCHFIAHDKAYSASRFTRPLTNKYKLEVSIPELLTIKEPQYQ